MLDEKSIFALCDQVREISFALHKYLRHGHLEKLYENGLAHRLRKLGLKVEQQFPIRVLDEDGFALGNYVADLLLDGPLIVEVKACERLADEHVAQNLGYLRACRIEHKLLINFSAKKLEIRKLVLSIPS